MFEDRYWLWSRDARARVRLLLLMARRGRVMRHRPQDDPDDHYAHAVPTVVGRDVLALATGEWLGE